MSDSKLRRFTPAQQDAFQKQRTRRPLPVADRADVPHIVFPKGSRFMADFDMTYEQIKAASDLLFAGERMREASDRLLKVLPKGCWHQFFGNWDFLKISNAEQD